MFLALQQRLDPPTPSTRPAAQLLRSVVTGSLSLLRGRGSGEPRLFAASRPLQSTPEPGPGTEAGRQVLTLGVPARSAARPQGAHSVISPGSLVPSDGNTAGRQGLKQARNRPWRTKEGSSGPAARRRRGGSGEAEEPERTASRLRGPQEGRRPCEAVLPRSPCVEPPRLSEAPGATGLQNRRA